MKQQEYARWQEQEKARLMQSQEAGVDMCVADLVKELLLLNQNEQQRI